MTDHFSESPRLGVAVVCALLMTASFGFLAPSQAEDSSPSFRKSIESLLKSHCSSCHDGAKSSGGLNLAALADDLSDSKNFSQWVKIHDRVRDGEMPPRDGDPLKPDDAKRLLGELNSALHAADAERQAHEGRALARRLNRDEYQNTLRDLLGIAEDYRVLLPEDGTALGFTKVGSALTVSAEHLEAYMAAADAALSEAIVTSPAPFVQKRMMPQRFNRLMSPDIRQRFAFAFIDAPDAIVRKTGLFDPILGFRAPATGVYHFRVRGYAYDSQTPVRARIRAGYGGDNAGGNRWLVGYESFPPEGATIDVTVRLHPQETLRIGPYAVGDREARRELDPNSRALALEWVEVEGPLFESWPPPGHRHLFGETNLSSATREDAERVLTGFLPRAFRRPIEDRELQHYLAIYDGASASGSNSGFLTGIKVALKAAFCSPHFLYLRAPAGPLDDMALASRLSYFLWDSLPDDELVAVAARKELRNPDELRHQVERMLADPKAAAFTESFTGQWLDLKKITATSPDAKLYPEYDELLEYSMVQETQRFFADILEHDLNVTNFVQSDFAILNDRLATHYHVPNVEGTYFRKVELPWDNVRGGILTHASVLKVTANGTTTSPVTRGAWVMDRLLDKPPPPPQAVAAIEPDIRGKVSIRDQLAQHRNDASCAACHAKIDPPGFALECFDVIGGWRQRYRAEVEGNLDRTMIYMPEKRRALQVGLGPKVDESGELPDGRAFKDFVEFRYHLLSDKDQLARALASKLITYGTGTGGSYADRAAIEQIVDQVRAKDYGFRSLVHQVVQSPLFTNQ